MAGRPEGGATKRNQLSRQTTSPEIRMGEVVVEAADLVGELVERLRRHLGRLLDGERGVQAQDLLGGRGQPGRARGAAEGRSLP